MKALKTFFTAILSAILLGIVLGIIVGFGMRVLESHRERKDFGLEMYSKCLDLTPGTAYYRCEKIRNRAEYNKNDYDKCVTAKYMAIHETTKQDSFEWTSAIEAAEDDCYNKHIASR